MSDKELLDYLEEMVKAKPHFELVFNTYNDTYIVRCSYIQAVHQTLRDAIADYKKQRDKVINDLMEIK